jgi:hypothetical protein
MYPNFKIPLGALSHKKRNPWYCIRRCWEKQKFEVTAFIPWVDCTLEQQTFHLGVEVEQKFEVAAFIPWVDCTHLEQQTFRLGVEVDSTIQPKAMKLWIDKYVNQLQAAISNLKLFKKYWHLIQDHFLPQTG